MTDKLWETYSEKISNYLNKRIHDNEIAKDLTQDTFVKVVAKKHKLNKIQNKEAWLYQIAQNTLIDYTRKKKEQNISDLNRLVEAKQSDYSKAEVKEIAQCLQELIQEYDEERREVLKLVFNQSLSQKEAAKYLDVPYSTLKSRIQKARKEIVKEFRNRCCTLKRNSEGDIIGCTPV